MRHDADFARAIVLLVEDEPAGSTRLQNLEIPGYDQPTIAEHIRLLIEEGLLSGSISSEFSDDVEYYGLRLRPAGHRFAAAARSEEKWRRAMDRVGEGASHTTFEALQRLLDQTPEDIDAPKDGDDHGKNP